jgi:hypothetical protein
MCKLEVLLISVMRSECPHGNTKLPSQPAFAIDCQAVARRFRKWKVSSDCRRSNGNNGDEDCRLVACSNAFTLTGPQNDFTTNGDP